VNVSLKGIFWDTQYTRLRAGWRILLQFVLMLVALVATGLLAERLDKYVPRDPLDPSASILLPVSVWVSTLLSVWVAGRLLDRRRFVDFGFRFSRAWWLDLAFGLGLGALLQTGIFLAESASGWVTVTGALGADRTGESFAASMLLALLFLLGVAVSEELWNRGYLLKNLAEGLSFEPFGPRSGILWASFITALLFGLLHATNPGASAVSTLALVLAGVLYASAYVLTGELAIPIGYHLTWNFFEGAVYGFPVSGYQLETSLLVTRVDGPAGYD
jgi:membrane protease YdiL (CAAX protease family)